MKRQLLPLTTLRFVAAFMVVLEHIKVYGGGGGIAVEFFFGLSGFILVYGYSRKFETPDLETVGQFYFMRIARLYPVYLLTFLVGCTFFIGAPYPYSAITTIRAALALHSLAPIGDQVFLFDGPSWSVSAEFFFYAMFPFIALGIHRLGIGKSTERIVAAWILLLIVRIGIAFRFAHTEVAYSFDWWLIYISPFVRITGFIHGMLIGYLFLLKKDAIARVRLNAFWWTVLEVFTLVVLIPATLLLMKRVPQSIAYGTIFAPTIALTLLVFGMQSGWISTLLSFRPFVYLGEISYSVYMTHDLVFQWAARFLSDSFFGYQSNAPWHVLAQCGLVLMVIALSDMLYRYVERPCREWARRRLATRNDTSRASASVPLS